LKKAISGGFNQNPKTLEEPIPIHNYATAEAAKAANLNSIGIIRGEEGKPLNPDLSSCRIFGNDLYFIVDPPTDKNGSKFF